MHPINLVVTSIPSTAIKLLSVHMVIVASEAGIDTVNLWVVGVKGGAALK